MNGILIHHTPTGMLATACDTYEADEIKDSRDWAECDCEDVTRSEPMASQLRHLWLNNRNAYCELTEKAFTAAELAGTADEHGWQPAGGRTYHPETNPRFVWAIGAIRESFPDIPVGATTGGVTLWDRQEQAVVAKLAINYGNLFCLEHNEAGKPLSDLEQWLNHMGPGDLASENIPDTR